MATRSKKSALIIGLVVVLIVIVLNVVNWFVYPFTSAKPNFADVEAVYSKLQIPSDWTVIDESENRGIAGRQCPVESSTMCFHLAKTYNAQHIIDRITVENIVLGSGCISVDEKDESQKDDPVEVYSYTCMSGGVKVIGLWERNGELTEVRFSTRSR
jgi:hypothetical protein